MTSANSKTHRLRCEVFTPDSLVKKMLDNLPELAWSRGKTFCDFTCGDGQILTKILSNRIAKGQDALESMKTLYGADISPQSVRLCRMRLIKAAPDVSTEYVKSVIKNIVWINQKNHPTGSLEYNFDFDNTPTTSDVSKWMNWARNGCDMSYDKLPVTEEIIESPGGDVCEAEPEVWTGEVIVEDCPTCCQVCGARYESRKQANQCMLNHSTDKC